MSGWLWSSGNGTRLLPRRQRMRSLQPRQPRGSAVPEHYRCVGDGCSPATWRHGTGCLKLAYGFLGAAAQCPNVPGRWQEPHHGRRSRRGAGWSVKRNNSIQSHPRKACAHNCIAGRIQARLGCHPRGCDPCICCRARCTPNNPSRSGVRGADHGHKKRATAQAAAAIPARPRAQPGAQGPRAGAPRASRGKDNSGRLGRAPPPPAGVYGLPPLPRMRQGGSVAPARLQGDRADRCARRRVANRPGGTGLAFPCLQQARGASACP